MTRKQHFWLWMRLKTARWLLFIILFPLQMLWALHQEIEDLLQPGFERSVEFMWELDAAGQDAKLAYQRAKGQINEA